LATGEPPLATGEKARPERWLAQLDSESYSERCDAQTALERLGRAGRQVLVEALDKGRIGARGRLHAVWVLARAGDPAIDDLLRIARSDSEPSVRAQAVRAVADLADPVLAKHRLDAGPGDASLAGRLADLGKGSDKRVLLEVVIALGRLRWANTPDWLRQHLGKPDAALAHAAMQALRRSGNWPALLKLLDAPGTEPLRAIALRAVAGRFEPEVVDGLIGRLGVESDPARRAEYADALARVCKKPGPWVYWGYRPPFRPANTVGWERTEAIGQALGRVLADPDRSLRLAVLRRMQREKVPVSLAALARWLADEHQADRVAALLASLGDQPAAEARPRVEGVVRDRKHDLANRRTALALFVRGLDEAAPAPLLALAQALEDGPVLADALTRLGKYPRLRPAGVLRDKLGSPDAEVRAAAIEALGELRAAEGVEPLPRLLGDADVRVRRAAAGAAGKLAARQAVEPLLKLVTDPDAGVRLRSLDSLRLLREPRAVPAAVAALADRPVALKALELLGELGGPVQADAVAGLARHDPSAEVAAAAVRVLTTWRDRDGVSPAQRQALDRAVADVHGHNGILVRWHVSGPVPARDAPRLIEQFASPGGAASEPAGRTLFAAGPEGRVLLAPKDADKGTLLFAWTDVAVPEQTAVEFHGSGNGLQVRLNGRDLQRNSDRFPGTLARGVNQVLIQVGGEAREFRLRFRRKSARVEHERLTQAALTGAGDPRRGRQLFFDADKSQCLKCHRLGDKGERIGPELTGVGGRFARVYLVESILEPSRTIAPSFGTLVLTLKSGKTLTGVKVAETETTLTLADNQGQKHTLAKADVEEQQPSPLSTMPEGLEKRFTEEEFVDLIAFLVSQKEGRTP
jgi:putative heme-binding domain-containing protein